MEDIRIKEKELEDWRDQEARWKKVSSNLMWRKRRVWINSRVKRIYGEEEEEEKGEKRKKKRKRGESKNTTTHKSNTREPIKGTFHDSMDNVRKSDGDNCIHEQKNMK